MTRRIAAMLALVVAAAPVVAAAQDSDHGALLAKRWCANCHVVERTATEGRADGLPSFIAIANRPGTSSESLRLVMTAEHGRMPNFALTRPEMNDLAAYIMSLRAPPK
jgi:mono/diheme cytochrome c family protein